MATTVKVKKILAVPHFHFDLEWWKKEDGYARDVRVILREIERSLLEFPELRYTLDQRDAILPYFQKEPEKQKLFAQWIQEGRLECVGGTLASPDENLPLGESLIRQFLLGKRFFQDFFQTTVEQGWQIDVFGHPHQMPQILKKCGFKTYTFARGAQPPLAHLPLFFNWEAPDGTQILTWWMANHYAGFFLPATSEAAAQRLYKKELTSRLKEEGQRARGFGFLPVPFGSDFLPPRREWIPFVKKWNATQSIPISFATPSEVFAKARKKREMPVVRTRLNPVFTGCYESRIKLKQAARKLQHRLLFLEKACALFSPSYPRDALDRAWELVVRNDFHDILCGTGTDAVYRSALSRYAQAAKHLSAISRDFHAALLPVRRTQTGGSTKKAAPEAPQQTLFNLNSSPRTLYLPVKQGMTCAHEGERLPSQPELKGDVVRVHLPPFTPVRLKLEPAAQKLPNPFHYASNELKTPFFQVRFHPSAGAISSLRFQGKEALSSCLPRCGAGTAGNLLGELTFREDGGNLWTIQETGRVRTFRDLSTKTSLLASGPLRWSLLFQRKARDLTVKTLYTFYADDPSMDIQYEVHNRLRAGRLQALFPLSFEHLFVDEPYYSFEISSPGIYPLQQTALFEKEKQTVGLTLFGTPSFQLHSDTAAVTLLRSVDFLPKAFFRFLFQNRRQLLKDLRKAWDLQFRKGLNVSEWALYDFHGIMLREWASPGGLDLPGGMNPLDHLIPYLFPRKTEALEEGRYRFSFRLHFSCGKRKESPAPFVGWALQEPVLKLSGERASTLSLPLPLPRTPALLTALKKTRSGDFLFRYFHPHGLPCTVTPAPGQQLSYCNMLEEPLSPLPSPYPLKPWEILTLSTSSPLSPRSPHAKA